MAMSSEADQLPYNTVLSYEFGSYLSDGFMFRLVTGIETFDDGNQRISYIQMSTPSHFGRFWETRTPEGELVRREGDGVSKEHILKLMGYASSVLEKSTDQQLTPQNKSMLLDVIFYGDTVLKKRVANEKRYLDNVVERAGEIVARHEEQFLDD